MSTYYLLGNWGFSNEHESTPLLQPVFPGESAINVIIEVGQVMLSTLMENEAGLGDLGGKERILLGAQDRSGGGEAQKF